MRQQFSSYLDHTITFLLLVVAGLTPLLFMNKMTEFYEMPKLAFLVVMTIVILGLWIFSWILKGKVILTRTALDIPLLVLAAIVLVSTYFSVSFYSSIYGAFPKVHGSAVSWIAYILLYFVTVSHLKGHAQIKTLLYVLYGSAVVVSLITILSFFKLNLPFDFAQAATFTPTGSTFSTVAFLLLLLPLPLLAIIDPKKYMPRWLAIILAIVFGGTVVLISSLTGLIALGLTFVLCLFVTKPNKIRKTLFLYLIPVVFCLFLLGLVYVPFPGNGVNSLASSFPREIQLPLSTSWKIAASAFRDMPFVGTGPATYLFDFTNYKSIEFNSNNFWAFSFDTAFNEFLQIFATLGLLGLIVLVIISVIILRSSWKSILSHTQEVETQGLAPALAVSGMVAVVLLLVHATTLVSIVMTLFVLAALMAVQRLAHGKDFEFSLGIKAATSNNRQIDLLPIIIFLLFLGLAAPGLYRAYTVVAADVYHRQAIALAGTSGSQAYQNLQKAEQMNPYIDLYRVDTAQTSFAIANAIAEQKGPSEASAAGNLSEQDRQTLTRLLTQSVREGRAAVALSPRSARNWEFLGSLYRNIAGVTQNALTYSLDAYGKAIQLDPLNPNLRISVGGLYYSVRNYDLAIRFFGDAANLKPDNANAYYNMSIALRDKGDLVRAKAAAERVVALLQSDTNNPSYKAATAYLTSLNEKLATGSAAKTAQTAPAAQTNSALGNQTVPGVNVADLNNPPQVATPSAVAANPEAAVAPAASPTPGPAAATPAPTAAPAQ